MDTFIIKNCFKSPRQMLSSLDVLENKMTFFLSKLLVIWANRQVNTLGKKKKKKDPAVCILSGKI